MTAITYYTSSVKNEFLKLKGTFAFWLTILSAFFIPSIYFLYYLLKSETLIPAEGANPWDNFLGQQIRSIIPFLIPMFIILLTNLIIQIEHKSIALKHLFSLPVPKWSIYFGKLTIVLIAMFSAYMLFYAVMLIAGFLVGSIHPELKLTAFEPKYLQTFKLLFRTFIAVLGMISIQFWLSFRIKNFIVPLGIGMILMITGLIVAGAKEAIYFPYDYNILSMFPKDGKVAEMVWFPKVAFYSLGYFILFSVLGFIDISRKNVK